MIVAVDVDSTLYDSAKLFADVAKEHFGIDLPRRATNWHDYYECAPVATLSKVFRKAHSHEFVAKNEPYHDAVEVCNMIADKGHEVVFVSDRHPQAEGALREWLKTFDFPWRDTASWNNLPSLVVGKDKRGWISKTRPDIMVDDRVRTMIFAKEHGSVVLSIVQPWNVNLKGEIEGIHICDNWQTLGKKIEEFI